MRSKQCFPWGSVPALSSVYGWFRSDCAPRLVCMATRAVVGANVEAMACDAFSAAVSSSAAFTVVVDAAAGDVIPIPGPAVGRTGGAAAGGVTGAADAHIADTEDAVAGTGETTGAAPTALVVVDGAIV